MQTPLFWLYSVADLESIAQLAGERVATYPPTAPPYYLQRAFLRRNGLDPDEDISLMPVRDDLGRLAMLRLGEARAATISSAIPPGSAELLGLRKLAQLGDEIMFPTTGVATTEAILHGERELIAAVVRAYTP